MEETSQTLEPLYARDSKGGIKLWKIKVIDDGAHTNRASIFVYFGQLGKTITEKISHIRGGKNKGKSNATNYIQQATLDALSAWKDKKKEGYKSLADLGIFKSFQNNEEIYQVGSVVYTDLARVLDDVLPKFNTDNNNNVKPMKAQKYYTPAGKIAIKFPCYGQPKINGFRCVAKSEVAHEGMLDFPEVKFRSKEGLEYKLHHIADEFRPEYFNLYREETEVIFDGEMYIHGKLLQDISAAVRKYNENTLNVEFVIFDIAIPDITQDERIRYLQVLHGTLLQNGARNVRVLPTTLIENDIQAQEFTDQCIANGYEGAIFRDIKATYKFGQRPKTMVKLKRFDDAEFKILDVVLPEDGNSDYSVLLCKNDTSEETFKCSIEGSLNYRSEIYLRRDDYKGKLATVKFYERTERGVPFHAVCTLIH